MKLFFTLFFFSAILQKNFSLKWTPNSWKEKKVYQDVVYHKEYKLEQATNELKKYAPLIFAGESLSLKEDLKKAARGESYVLMGGDCAETFREFSVQNIMNNYRILLQMTLILMYNMSKPVVKIGRMAGQYAKPRSDLFETRHNLTLPSYRGDIINCELFDTQSRLPNPDLMLKAYSYSVQTMNLIRALSEGGYADIQRIQDWNLDFAKKDEVQYQKLSREVMKSLAFLKSIGLENLSESKKARFYTAHESLLLPYEEALTRKDSITQKYFDCSAHMIWIGERTRQLDGAHVEFARGLENPVGIKISENFDIHEIEVLIRTLNPDNELGKIVLITRMGNKICDGLPRLVEMIKRRKLEVVWISDPMHGNTVKLDCGLKTRYLECIKQEYEFFHSYLKSVGVNPGGIHLELTGRNVTECLYRNNDYKENLDLIQQNYETGCDPRLSADQCLDLAFFISSLENK